MQLFHLVLSRAVRTHPNCIEHVSSAQFHVLSACFLDKFNRGWHTRFLVSMKSLIEFYSIWYISDVTDDIWLLGLNLSNPLKVNKAQHSCVGQISLVLVLIFWSFNFQKPLSLSFLLHDPHLYSNQLVHWVWSLPTSYPK
jgi:hypothetical protein